MSNESNGAARGWIPGDIATHEAQPWDGETVPVNRVDLGDCTVTNSPKDNAPRNHVPRYANTISQEFLKRLAGHLIAMDQIALHSDIARPETISLTLTRDEAYEIGEIEGTEHIASSKYLNPDRLSGGISYEEKE